MKYDNTLEVLYARVGAGEGSEEEKATTMYDEISEPCKGLKRLMDGKALGDSAGGCG